MLRRHALRAAVLAAVITISTVVSFPISAAEESSRFGALLSRVPAGANTLIMLDVEAIRNSMFARNTPAKDKPGAKHVNRYVFGAKELDQAVLAADIDLAEFIPTWETVLVNTNIDPVLADLAQQQNGRVEQLGSMQAVWLPTNGYVVPFTSRQIGMRFPADRQFVSRWINHAPIPDGSNLSPYLQVAAAYPENVGTEIIMALDLENAVDPGAVRAKLDETKAVQNREVDLDDLARVMASVRGVTLGIRVTTRISGSLRIDFSEDAGMMEGFAKSLIIEKLGGFGARLDDFHQWEARVDKNSVFLSGGLSIDGLRLILMLVDPPTPNLSGSDEVSEGEATAQKTFEYYKALETLVHDVQNPDTKNVVGAGEVAIWMDRCAKKIDRLPLLGVDEQLVDFAAQIAQALRDMSGQYRGVGIEASKYSNNAGYRWDYAGGSYGGGYGWGGYRGGAWEVGVRRPTMSASNVAKRTGRADASSSRAELWTNINNDMATARRELTKRYQIEF